MKSTARTRRSIAARRIRVDVEGDTVATAFGLDVSVVDFSAFDESGQQMRGQEIRREFSRETWHLAEGVVDLERAHSS